MNMHCQERKGAPRHHETRTHARRLARTLSILLLLALGAVAAVVTPAAPERSARPPEAAARSRAGRSSPGSVTCSPWPPSASTTLS